jgi:hypothetical protein
MSAQRITVRPAAVFKLASRESKVVADRAGNCGDLLDQPPKLTFPKLEVDKPMKRLLASTSSDVKFCVRPECVDGLFCWWRTITISQAKVVANESD